MVRTSEDGTSNRHSSYLHPSEQTRDFRSCRRHSLAAAGLWQWKPSNQRGRSAVWLSRWEVWNQNAPERRVWRVSYGPVSEISTRASGDGELESDGKRLRSALAEICAFSEKHDCSGFTACFVRAIETLDSGGAKRHGYHKDLIPNGAVSDLATSMLDACQSAWVFGGMGSWNDMSFERAEQTEYDRVSEQLFNILNETIQTAANASSALNP